MLVVAVVRVVRVVVVVAVVAATVAAAAAAALASSGSIPANVVKYLVAAEEREKVPVAKVRQPRPRRHHRRRDRRGHRQWQRIEGPSHVLRFNDRHNH